MTNEVQNKIRELEDLEKKLFEVSKPMLGSVEGIYPIDIFTVGVINRSLSLISGFLVLIEGKNFIGASHLVRPHLDNFLRFLTLWLVDKPHDLASKVTSGTRIDKLRDRNGKLLKDWYLVEAASLKYSWMKNVYEVTSGFVHFSGKHIRTSMRPVSLDERTIELAISKFDKYVPDESKLEAIDCMIAITEAILTLIQDWMNTKEGKSLTSS